MPSAGSFSAQGVQHAVGAHRRRLRAQVGVQLRPMHRPLLYRPIVRDGRERRHAAEGLIHVGGFVEERVDAAVDVGGLVGDVHDRNRAQPLLVVDLDRIVAHGDDQVGVVDEALHVGAARAAQDARPIGMALGQPALAVHGRDEGDSLTLHEGQQFPGRAATGEAEAGHHHGPAALGERVGDRGNGGRGVRGRRGFGGNVGRRNGDLSGRLCAADVLGQVEVHGARRLGSRDGERLGEAGGDVGVAQGQ